MAIAQQVRKVTSGWQALTPGTQYGSWGNVDCRTDNMTISFFGIITSLWGEWRNVFHVGAENMARRPAAWIVPGQSQIHFRMAT